MFSANIYIYLYNKEEGKEWEHSRWQILKFWILGGKFEYEQIWICGIWNEAQISLPHFSLCHPPLPTLSLPLVWRQPLPCPRRRPCQRPPHPRRLCQLSRPPPPPWCLTCLTTLHLYRSWPWRSMLNRSPSFTTHHTSSRAAYRPRTTESALGASRRILSSPAFQHQQVRSRFCYRRCPPYSVLVPWKLADIIVFCCDSTAFQHQQVRALTLLAMGTTDVGSASTGNGGREDPEGTNYSVKYQLFSLIFFLTITFSISLATQPRPEASRSSTLAAVAEYYTSMPDR